MNSIQTKKEKKNECLFPKELNSTNKDKQSQNWNGKEQLQTKAFNFMVV